MLRFREAFKRMSLKNNIGCFFGRSPQPSMQTITLPDPIPRAAPLPTPTSPEPSVKTAADRRKKIKHARLGMLSTIKTSPMGITGTGSNLMSAAGGKTVLGA